jgi:hypothetical protein
VSIGGYATIAGAFLVPDVALAKKSKRILMSVVQEQLQLQERRLQMASMQVKHLMA